MIARAVAVAGLALTVSAAGAPGAPAASSLLQLRDGSRVALSVPAGFFGPGSPAVQRSVQLAGRRLGDLGPFELGNGDTVLEADGAPPAVGSRRTLRLAPAEAAWRARQPLVVQGTSWAVRFDIAPGARQSLGRLTLRRTHRGGGTFDTSFSVVPRITFTSAGRRLVLDLAHPANAALRPALTFSARDVLWRTSCPRGVRTIARLGGRICLGARAARGVTWTARSTAASSRLVLGPVPARRQRLARVSRSARIGKNVTLGSGVTIGARARVGDGAVIGPRARIGARAVVGRLAVVGKRTVVGAGARLGSRATADADAIVSTRARLEAGAVVGAASRVDAAATIGARSRLGSGARVGARVTVGADVTAGRNVSIGVGPAATRSSVGAAQSESTSVAAGTFLAEGATVARGTSQREDLVTCSPRPGLYRPSFPRPVTVAQCGGAVSECVPSTVTRRDPAPETQITPTPGVPAGLGGQLATDVGSDIAPPANGGTGQPYVRGEHDCIDFADLMERKLQARGYNATFTIIWRLNPDRTWYNRLWTDKWINGHCVTDVHRPGGTILWIEPQFTAADQPAGGVNLDYDADGTVGVSSGRPVDHTTDDGYRIEVYESREAARAAGANVR